MIEINIASDETNQESIAKDLSNLLADTYVLMLKAQAHHWNVTGPHFQMLHAQFQEQYEELFIAVDKIAERIRILDVKAPGTLKEFQALTSLDATATTAEEMLRDLLAAHEATVHTTRSCFPTAQKAGDEGTVDLATERLAAHEYAAWILRSHLG